MADRRTEILDAALRVLAEHGMRGLTHRAVDAAAGIAPGSTSYYFRSRSALVEGCVDRLLEIDQAAPEVVAVRVHGPRRRGRGGGGGDGDDRAAPHARPLRAQRRGRAGAAVCARRSCGRRRHPRVRRPHARRRGRGDPAAAAAEIAALLDGLVFTALVRGPHDPAALAAWVRPPLERALRAGPPPERVRVAVTHDADVPFSRGGPCFRLRRGTPAGPRPGQAEAATTA